MIHKVRESAVNEDPPPVYTSVSTDKGVLDVRALRKVPVESLNTEPDQGRGRIANMNAGRSRLNGVCRGTVFFDTVLSTQPRDFDTDPAERHRRDLADRPHRRHHGVGSVDRQVVEMIPTGSSGDMSETRVIHCVILV